MLQNLFVSFSGYSSASLSLVRVLEAPVSKSEVECQDSRGRLPSTILKTTLHDKWRDKKVVSDLNFPFGKFVLKGCVGIEFDSTKAPLIEREIPVSLNFKHANVAVALRTQHSAFSPRYEDSQLH